MQDSEDKGKRFEKFVRAFFRQVPNLEIRNDAPSNIGWTDLDVVVLNRNESLKDLFGTIIVVQCKNYSDPISWKVIAASLIQALVFGKRMGQESLQLHHIYLRELKKL